MMSRRLPLRVLVREGASRNSAWGRVEVTPPRNLAMHAGRAFVTLTIYPPGTSRAERWWLTLQGEGRAPVVASAALALLCGFLWSWPGLVVAVAAAAIVRFVAARRSRRTRRSIRRVRVTALADQRHGVRAHGERCDLFEDVIARLDALENEDLPDALAYEAEWWNIYELV